jgi:hypothetical protein
MEDTDIDYAYRVSDILHKRQYEEWGRPTVWPQDLVFKKTAEDRFNVINERAMEVLGPLEGHNWCFFESEELRGHIPRLLAAASEQGMQLILEFLSEVKRTQSYL